MKGRKRIPSSINDLRGNPGKRKENGQEPKPAPGPARARPPLPLTKEGGAHWRRLLKQLRDAKIYTQLDGPALALLADALAKWQKAQEHIIQHGAVMFDDDGRLLGQNPNIGVQQDAFKTLSKLMVEFGLTPSSRARLKVETPAAPDAMDEFLNGG